MIMKKPEFIEYCKKLSNIFNEAGQPITVEDIDKLIDDKTLISVIDTPITVNVLIREGNTGGTIHWRGSK